MAASWRRLRDEKLHNLYASPNVIRVVKSRMIGRASSTHWSGEKCIRNFSRKAWKEDIVYDTYDYSWG